MRNYGKTYGKLWAVSRTMLSKFRLRLHSRWQGVLMIWKNIQIKFYSIRPKASKKQSYAHFSRNTTSIALWMPLICSFGRKWNHSWKRGVEEMLCNVTMSMNTRSLSVSRLCGFYLTIVSSLRSNWFGINSKPILDRRERQLISWK